MPYDVTEPPPLKKLLSDLWRKRGPLVQAAVRSRPARVAGTVAVAAGVGVAGAAERVGDVQEAVRQEAAFNAKAGPELTRYASGHGILLTPEQIRDGALNVCFTEKEEGVEVGCTLEYRKSFSEKFNGTYIYAPSYNRVFEEPGAERKGWVSAEGTAHNEVLALGGPDLAPLQKALDVYQRQSDYGRKSLKDIFAELRNPSDLGPGLVAGEAAPLGVLHLTQPTGEIAELAITEAFLQGLEEGKASQIGSLYRFDENAMLLHKAMVRYYRQVQFRNDSVQVDWNLDIARLNDRPSDLSEIHYQGPGTDEWRDLMDRRARSEGPVQSEPGLTSLQDIFSQLGGQPGISAYNIHQLGGLDCRETPITPELLADLERGLLTGVHLSPDPRLRLLAMLAERSIAQEHRLHQEQLAGNSERFRYDDIPPRAFSRFRQSPVTNPEASFASVQAAQADLTEAAPVPEVPVPSPLKILTDDVRRLLELPEAPTSEAAPQAEAFVMEDGKRIGVLLRGPNGRCHVQPLEGRIGPSTSGERTP